MKNLLLSLCIILLSLSLSAQQMQHSRIMLNNRDVSPVRLAALGINTDHLHISNDGFPVLEISSHDIQKIKDQGIEFETLIPDMQAWYESRNAGQDVDADMLSRSLLSQNYPVPAGFSLGSLGGFCTYDEYLVHIDNLHATYPSFFSAKQPISSIKTIEGRDIYYVKIANSNQSGPKPKVLYTGMIHAREPIGMQHFLFLMYYLMENYPTNPEVQYLVDHAELYFVPVVNPDGYLHNQQIAPNGGGMWRKNRRPNDDGSFGVDINRNFGYQWGYDNIGSSPFGGDETYRGTHAFSEPETQALKEFCESKTFTIALNYHSYSNLLLYPWGYFTLPSPDDHIFFEHARRMTSDNGYVYGPSSTTIYTNNGGSDDWMYGDTSTKPPIFAYTPEVGSVNDGFWPDINRIIPQCQENMYQSLMAAHLSMKYAEVNMLGSTVVSSFSNDLDFSIRRLGFQDEGVFTVFLQPVSENVTVTSEPVVFTDMALLETRSGQMSFFLDPETAGGTFFNLLLGVDNGHFIRYDTLKMVFGIEQNAFFDDCSSLSQWTGNWGLSTVHYVSPPSSITDSPTGNYPFLGSRTTTTINAIDLSDAASAFLRFKSRWDINGNGAYVQVRISKNGGNTWIPMAGKYTRPGLPNAVAGQPVYSDKQLHWVSEEIDLSQFAGDQILIRFHLSSNSWGVATADGLYFDDIGVYKVLPLAPVNAGFSAGTTLIMQGSGVQFEDQSVGIVNSWLWEFDGGEPLVSSLQNPFVFYPDGGVFDVKLIAGNGDISDTLLLHEYITVLDSILCRPAIFAGGSAWILPGQIYNTTAATAENFSSLRWSSTGDGTFINNTLLHTTYTPGAADETAGEVRLILTAMPVYDLCETATDTLVLFIDDFSGAGNSELQQISVHPNPAGEVINISFPHVVNHAYVEVSDLNGRIIKQISAGSRQHIHIPAGNLNQGLYILKISTEEGFYTTRLAIIR